MAELAENPTLEFRPLPEAYRNKGINFSLLERNDKAAIYQSTLGTFEVIAVEIAEERRGVKFPNGSIVDLPRMEVLPPDSSSGDTLFSFQNKEAAMLKYQELSS